MVATTFQKRVPSLPHQQQAQSHRQKVKDMLPHRVVGYSPDLARIVGGATIGRRLAVAAKALGITLVIKRSGEDVYFWREDGVGEEPTRRRGRRPRMGSPGGALPISDQPFTKPEDVAQGVVEEDSPELGQTPV
jgi:hypothetical protein